MLRLVAVVLCLGCFSQYADAANCHMREIDLCVATIMISATDGVPGNDEDVDKVCEPVAEGFDCIGNYTKLCFTPFMQEIFEMVVAEPKKMQKQLCTHGTEERAKYLKHAPCFQTVLSNENVRPLIDDMLAAMEKATESKFQDRIPIMCCGIQRLFKTAVEMVSEECGSEVLDEGSEMIGFSISSLSDMFCRGYEPESPKCAGILPASGSPYKGVDSDNQLIRFMASAMANFS